MRRNAARFPADSMHWTLVVTKVPTLSAIESLVTTAPGVYSARRYPVSAVLSPDALERMFSTPKLKWRESGKQLTPGL